MTKIINWIKNNKIASILILLVVYFIFQNNYPFRAYPSQNEQYLAFKSLNQPSGAIFSQQADSLVNSKQASFSSTESNDRLVIKNSTLSLLVDNVVKTQKLILQKTQELGGFMVSSSVSNPSEAASASIVVRIPANKLDTALDIFRTLAVKVTSENLQGEDVTDQYTDIQARIDTFLKTKQKLEEIMDKATDVSDIMQVQRELINLQTQLDSVRGQELYLKRNAAMARVTIYLATDELALPYTPTELWRPQLIFKEAVRSLIITLRKIGNILIWLVVYSVIILPVFGIIYLIRRRKRD